jgi:Flp pilus assembly pilin Flp
MGSERVERARDRSERGQATVEWTGLLLLVAVALVALGHVASRADGQELGASLAHSVTHPARDARIAPSADRPLSPPAAHPRRPAAELARPRHVAASPPAVRMERGRAVELLRRAGRDGVRRAGRGAGALWRKAWFACLVYERFRYAMRHPESRRPEYTFPYDVALRMVNGCAVPVDLLRGLPTLDPGP